MSEDQIKLIQSLIESGNGDIDRLRTILDTLQKGNHLDENDQNYLHTLSNQSPTDELETTNSSLEKTSSDTTPEEKIPQVENSDDSIPQETKPAVSKSPFRKKILTVAVIVGIIVATYAALDVYAVFSLQFRPHHGNQYLMSQTQVFIQSDVCNPSYFPATFNKYVINAYYKSDSVETAEISGSIISPKTYAILDGVFTLNQQTITKLQQENLTFDPNQAHVTTTVDAPIFGVIPFSVVKEYAGTDFQKVLKNGPPGSFSCG